jgi:predicted RNase H-like HicB family nuclease
MHSKAMDTLSEAMDAIPEAMDTLTENKLSQISSSP